MPWGRCGPSCASCGPAPWWTRASCLPWSGLPRCASGATGFTVTLAVRGEEEGTTEVKETDFPHRARGAEQRRKASPG